MKTWLSKGALLAAIALPALSGAAWAGGTDDFGCSNATLKSEYAFGVTGYTPPGLPDGPPSVVAGIKTFDGKGQSHAARLQGRHPASPVLTGNGATPRKVPT